MSLEIITKAIEEHATAVAGLQKSVEEKSANIEQRMAGFEGIKKQLEDTLKKSQRPGLSRASTDEVGTGIVAQFSESQQFGAMAKGLPSTGRVPMEGVSIKALTNTGRGVSGSTDYSIQPQRVDGLFNNPQRVLTLLDVLPSLPVSVGSFEYMQLNGYTNNAAFQTLEGDAKAETDLPTVVVQAQVSTIAHWIKASVQVLEDAPALTQQVDNLLNYGLLAKLEAEIVSGVAGTGKIKGLIEHATEFSVTGTPGAADAIGQAVVNLNANGWLAGVIVLNPVDWFAIASERAGTGDGQYILGSPRDPSPPSLWGVPVVTTPSLAAGSALVLDPFQVAILDRQQPAMMASRDTGANFTSNMVTILVEMRAGLAVFSPGAVLVVDIT